MRYNEGSQKSEFEVIKLDLNINSPSFYTQQYGVNDRVYRYCQKCYEYFKDKEYSEVLTTIGICLQCAPMDLYQQGKYKEMVRFIGNKSCACIYIRIDFDQYHNATDEEKVIIIENTILKAIKKVRAKGKFDYESFSQDLQKMVEN